MENVIEFLTGDNVAALTLSQGRYKSKIEKLAKSHPEECQIIARNEDGSIFAHVPTKWVKISPPRQVEMTDERKEELRERLKKIRRE